MAKTTGSDKRQDETGVDSMAGRRPWIRVDEAIVREDPDKSGTYQVQINGHNLKMAISPPRIEVGGVPMTGLQFARDGSAIVGQLAKKPADAKVVVDYGFADDSSELQWDEAKIKE